MKLIISYQDGSSEIIAIAACEIMEFRGEHIYIEYTRGNASLIAYKDVRSIVIA